MTPTQLDEYVDDILSADARGYLITARNALAEAIRQAQAEAWNQGWSHGSKRLASNTNPYDGAKP